MFRSWKIGTAFGIGIYVHWSFLLLAGWVLLSNWGSGGMQTAVFMVTLLLAVFGCVVLHELGHALMARYFGIGTRDITLYPIGGVARLERMSHRPWEEACIAVAGPAVNVVIAGLLCVVVVFMGVMRMGDVLVIEPSSLSSFSLSLFLANLLLVGFNMLPVFPMDGGRVLRAILAGWLGRLRATEIAARVGMGIALLAIPVVLLVPQFSNPMLLLVIFFVIFAGQQELASVRRSEALRRAEPIDVLPADEELIPASSEPANSRFSGLTWDTRFHVWVMWRDGQAVATYSVGPE